MKVPYNSQKYSTTTHRVINIFQYHIYHIKELLPPHMHFVWTGQAMFLPRHCKCVVIGLKTLLLFKDFAGKKMDTQFKVAQNSFQHIPRLRF